MAAKSIIDIDVNDDKFQSFMEKFKEYQAALEELPEAWRGLAHGATDATKETAKAKAEGDLLAKAFSDGASAILTINSGLDRLTESLDRANKSQEDFNKKTRSSKGFLSDATKDAKSLAGHIRDATTSLLSWGGIVGLFTGVLGVGGLFGINRLASGAASQRFTTLGLGTTSGGLDSTAINYQRALSNPTGTLGAIRDSQLDLSKRWQFQAMGINNPDQDPAKLLPQMIRNARDIFVKNGSNLQGAEAHGLTNFFTLDDLNRFKNMSDAEIDSMEKQSQKDAVRLQLTDQQLKQWQDFNVQLQRSGYSIENSFIRGLAPLAPQLTRLSDSVSGMIDSFLKSPELGKWIDGLSQGIQKFGEYLASPSFRTDIDSFMKSIRDMGLTVDNVIRFLNGTTLNGWNDSVADSANSSAKWVKEKTGFDPQTVGPAIKDLFSIGSKKIKDWYSGGSITPVDPTPADVTAKGRTIADRFNNPGNLRWADGYGTHNTKSGKFAVFPTLDEGVLAATKQLQIYGSKGINNVKDIVKTWAPSNENDTDAYIRHVVKSTKFSENEKLNLNDPAVLAKLISAMATKEGAGSRVTEGAVIQIYNNTGGNAIVNSAQLGGYG
ncbi:LysM domain-containing protein [Yersinia frederiksenii]|nr:LysM domain-containing protein [Yersinia frederiksenii]CNL69835.1 LysM domain-containing protein [Yersinia frederiksenii]